MILGRGWIWVGGVEKVILCYDNPMPISTPSGRKPPPKCRKPVSDNFAQTRGGIASGPAPAAGASIADGDAERGGGAQPAHAQPSYSSCPPSNLRRASRVTDRWRKAAEGREAGGTRGRCSVGGETGASASPSDSRELAAAGHWSPAASSREAAQSHGSAHGQRRAAADRRSGRGGRVSNGRRTSDEPAPPSAICDGETSALM